MIVSHHERWDGAGYPHGLAGEAIPVVARILTVADVYDALTSVRSYKRAMTHDEAMGIMRSDVGRVFDPMVFAWFEACVTGWLDAGGARSGAAVPTRRITITANGEARTVDVEPRLLLAHLLRQGLQLTGTHTGCDTTSCGACTVLFDGRPVKKGTPTLHVAE